MLKKSAAYDAMKKLESDGVILLQKRGTRGEKGEPSWWRYIIESPKRLLAVATDTVSVIAA